MQPHGIVCGGAHPCQSDLPFVLAEMGYSSSPRILRSAVRSPAAHPAASLKRTYAAVRRLSVTCSAHCPPGAPRESLTRPSDPDMAPSISPSCYTPAEPERLSLGPDAYTRHPRAPRGARPASRGRPAARFRLARRATSFRSPSSSRDSASSCSWPTPGPTAIAASRRRLPKPRRRRPPRHDRGASHHRRHARRGRGAHASPRWCEATPSSSVASQWAPSARWSSAPRIRASPASSASPARRCPTYSARASTAVSQSADEAHRFAQAHDVAAKGAALAPRPLLLSHGRNDDMVPVGGTLRLFEAVTPILRRHPRPPRAQTLRPHPPHHGAADARRPRLHRAILPANPD